MTKGIFLFILTLVFYACFADSNKECVGDSIYFFKLNNSNWELSAIEYKTFDANNNIISKTKILKIDTAWVNSYQETYTYDNQNNLIEFISKNWVNNNWENDDRNTYAYNTNNQRIRESIFNWDTNQWINVTRNNYTYDTNGKTIELLVEKGIIGAWENETQIFYSYNNGIYNSQINQSWVNNNWVNNTKSINTYFNNDILKPLESIWQQWDGNNWQNNNRNTRAYNNNGNLIDELSQNWDGSNWINVDNYVTTYTNNVREKVYKKWVNNNWKIVNRGVSTKNNLNYEIEDEFISQDWNGSTWVNRFKIISTYTLNNIIVKQFLQFWQNNQWSPSTEERWYYNEDEILISNVNLGNYANNIWNRGDSIQYYACKEFLSSNYFSKPEDKINIYPNPCSHFVYFSNGQSIQNIYVHSVDGKQIHNLPLVNNGIDISALPNGLYFITLITEKEKIHKRFIKFSE